MNQESLLAGANLIGVSIDKHQQKQLEEYLILLQKWNRVYNLTAIKDNSQMIKHHVLDSLVLIPPLKKIQNHVQPFRIADIGTGAGLPGIILAIIYPDNKYYLVDSNGKKTRFLTQVKIELGLNNCTIINERIENFKPEYKFDLVTSRAFATLKHFIDNTKDIVKSGGHMVAMKGKYPHHELEDLSDTVNIIEVLPVQVPFMTDERHLVIIRN